jgi:hypothetical protein
MPLEKPTVTAAQNAKIQMITTQWDGPKSIIPQLCGTVL